MIQTTCPAKSIECGGGWWVMGSDGVELGMGVGVGGVEAVERIIS